MWFIESLVSPVGKQLLVSSSGEFLQFGDDFRGPMVKGTPILVSDNSLFSVDEIISQKPLTQDRNYADQSNLKNLIRKKILPSLSWDRQFEDRYKKIASAVEGGKVLIIGAGNKIDFYKKIFSKSRLVVSDVHMQFGADVVFDAHEIPFPPHFFDLIVAAQVMEHTVRPWQVAAEMQRVSAHNGIIQIEVPFAFPYHGLPYDFFRFTFSGLRTLFKASQLIDYKASEGVFSANAIASAQSLMNIFSAKYLKYGMLAITRFLFFWMKYLDAFSSGDKLSDFLLPKGFYMTFRKDEKARTDLECISEVQLLLRK